MRTAKRVTILVDRGPRLHRPAVLRAGQGNAPQAFKEPSNTPRGGVSCENHH